MIQVFEYRLPDIQKDILGEAFAGIAQSTDVAHSFSPLDFFAHIDGHALGSMIAQHMPDEMLLSLREFSSNQDPNVIVLRNFPLQNEVIAPCVLKAINYAMNNGYIESYKGSKNQNLTPVKADNGVRGVHYSQLYSLSLGTETQKFHQDDKSDHATVFLGCFEGGDNEITTNFNDAHYGFNADAASVPAKQKVALLNGDIVIFKDHTLHHARQNHRPHVTKPQRCISVLDAGNFFMQQFPDNWKKRVEQRGSELLIQNSR